MVHVEFKSVGPGKCRWCKKDKDEVIDLAFSDGSFVGRYCYADFKKALADKVQAGAGPGAGDASAGGRPKDVAAS